MAILKSTASGNFTASGTWGLVDTPSQLSLTSSSPVTTTMQPASTTWVNSGTPQAQGFLIYLTSVVSSPGSTLTVALLPAASLTPLASVAIPNADLVGKGGTWIYAKFTTPFTMVNGTTYRIGVQASANSVYTVGVNALGANWSRYLVTGTNQAPSTGDTLYIQGDFTSSGTSSYTVTMDSTATTAYGVTNVSWNGTLAYGTALSTNYYLKLTGNLNVIGGTFTMGTAAAPIDSSSTAKLEFNNGAVQGAYFLSVSNGGTVMTYGASKVVSAKLAANMAAAATTATTNVSTDWAANDVITLASTSRTYTEAENLTVSSTSGTTVTFTRGAVNAHLGTSPTQADLVNITRNVQIFGSSTGAAYVTIATASVVSFAYTAFYYMGPSSSVGAIYIPSAMTTGSVSVTYCSFYNIITAASMFWLAVLNAAPITFQYNVISGVGSSTGVGITVQNGTNGVNSIATTIISNNIIIRTNGIGYNINKMAITCQNNIASSCNSYGFSLGEGGSNSTSGLIGVFDNNVAYSGSTVGFYFVTAAYAQGTISNCTAWRNNSVGMQFNGSRLLNPLVIDTCTFFGNNGSGMAISIGGLLYVKNCTFDGGTTLVTSQGISVNGADSAYIYNCSFSQSSAHSTSDLQTATGNGINVICYNCRFGATPLGSQTTMSNSFSNLSITSMNHNQLSGINKAYTIFGTFDTDTTIFNSSTRSLRMTPSSAGFKLVSYPFKIAIQANDTVTISALVRKSLGTGGETLYQGAAPRLVAFPNPITGTTTYTVLATSVAANGVWETITGTFTPTISGVYMFGVDCDLSAGSGGWVNVDDITCNYARDTTKMDFWDGQPYINTAGVPKERTVSFLS